MNECESESGSDIETVSVSYFCRYLKIYLILCLKRLMNEYAQFGNFILLPLEH